MREIKFRIWKGDHFESLGFVHRDYPCRFHCNDYSINPDCITQYTGLKDDDGIEIYEGDIVQYSFGTPSCVGQSAIEYNGSSFMVKTDEFTPKKATLYTLCECTNVTVVGNIYEHRHLLEAK